MPTHKGISLSLIADGEELPELSVKVRDSKMITSIIIGDEGVEFAYEYVNNSETDILIDPILDGHKTGEVVHCAAGAQGHDVGPGTSATTVRAFRFRRVSSDFDSDDGLSSSLGALGVLEFRIIRVKVNSFHEDIPLEGRTWQIEASLGRTINMDEDHPWLPPPEHWENIDPQDDPYVIFRFQYISEAQLRSLITYDAHDAAAVQSWRSLSPQPARHVKRGKQPQLVSLDSEYHRSDSEAEEDRMSKRRKRTVSSRSRTSSSTVHVKLEPTRPRLEHHELASENRRLRLAIAKTQRASAELERILVEYKLLTTKFKDAQEKLQGNRA